MTPFVLLSNELDCNRCIAKQTKIMKMIGALSTTTILHICRHVVNYIHSCNHSTSFLLILPHDKAVIFEGKFACFEEGDKFGYSTTEPLRATATKLGSCDKHPVYCQKLGSLFSYVL